MGTNGLINRHWVYVARHLCTDFGIFVVAFLGGTLSPAMRPLLTEFRVEHQDPGEAFTRFAEYTPAVLCGALIFACLVYIVGLYAPLRMEHAFANRFGRLFGALAFAMIVVVAVGYINWSARVGRGVMVYSTAIAALFLFAHHYRIYRRSKNYRERVVFIVNNRFDESEARAFASFGGHLEFIGIVTGSGYKPESTTEVLGQIDEIEEIVEKHRVKRVLCTTSRMDDPEMAQGVLPVALFWNHGGFTH